MSFTKNSNFLPPPPQIGALRFDPAKIIIDSNRKNSQISNTGLSSNTSFLSKG
jgi:hypothetical protein